VDRFSADINRAARRARAAKTVTEVKAAMKQMEQAFQALLLVRSLIDWDVPRENDWDNTTGKDMARVLDAFKAGRHGKTARKAAPALLKLIAARRIREADEAFAAFRSPDDGWELLQPLVTLDPKNADAYKAKRAVWQRAQDAAEARLAAEMDAWVASLAPPYYPGCDGDGDGDGICYE
jgi:hypothetical protein